MTTSIQAISKEEFKGLLSSGAWEDISPEQVKNLREWLSNTIRLWAGRVDDDLICVFGVVAPSLVADCAYLWLWETDKLKDHEFIFVRRSQIIIKDLLKRYPKIIGMCLDHAEHSIRWIKWLGGQFEKPHEGYVSFVIRGTE